MSDKGYAVGFVERSVKATVGGGVSTADADADEVNVSGVESLSWRRMLAPYANSGNGAAKSTLLKSIS
jgi:hypothetical protein